MRRSGSVGLGVVVGCVVVLAGVFGSGGAGTSSAQVPAESSEWQQLPNVPADVDFRNVVMSGMNTGIAVGKQGDRGVAYVLHWTALDFAHHTPLITPVAFNFRAPLWAAVLVGEDTWAVGEQGLIVHESNGVWREVSSPLPGAQLLTLQMLGNGEEGWAGGFLPRPGPSKPEPVILHYTNGQWQRDDRITGDGDIRALHFAQGGGWAVGDAGIWRYRDGEWSREQEPNPCPETRCFQTYSSVRAINNDEAWIAGSSIGLCGICVPRPYVLHREGGSWQIAVNGGVQGDPTRPGAGRSLYGLATTGPDPNAPVRSWAVGSVSDGFDSRPYILSHSSEQTPSVWQYVPYPAGAGGQLTSVSAPDYSHAMAVGTGGVILSFGYVLQTPPTPAVTPTSTLPRTPVPAPGGSNPTERVPDPHNPNLTYFAEVGHTLGGGFRDYWQQHGGLAQFGYPLTEEFAEISPTDGRTYVTQYFERARFEYHPENRPPYDVLLGLLGRTITQGREDEQPFRPAPRDTGNAGALYFPETGHNIAPEFAGYWQQHGGLPVYGYPISEPFTEVSRTDGRPYLVQYFERNRLEYHPELPEPYRVSLGLLGVQVLQQKGWIAGLTP